METVPHIPNRGRGWRWGWGRGWRWGRGWGGGRGWIREDGKCGIFPRKWKYKNVWFNSSRGRAALWPWPSRSAASGPPGPGSTPWTAQTWSSGERKRFKKKTRSPCRSCTFKKHCCWILNFQYRHIVFQPRYGEEPLLQLQNFFPFP